jgi:hypothetical protein
MYGRIIPKMSDTAPFGTYVTTIRPALRVYSRHFRRGDFRAGYKHPAKGLVGASSTNGQENPRARYEPNSYPTLDL